MDKKILYSATKPTGELTIGNYLGAIKNWLNLQDEYNCYFCIANLHSHTIDLSADFVKEKTLKQFAMFLACGGFGSWELFCAPKWPGVVLYQHGPA